MGQSSGAKFDLDLCSVRTTYLRANRLDLITTRVFQLGKKGFNARAMIDACRPFEWMKDLPPIAESSPELKEKIYNKWKKVVEG